MYAEIRERRTAPDLAERTDVLSRLIVQGEDGDALTDTELRDQLVTLLLAGHETTATALAWALYEVGRDPALLARCRTAADEGDDDFLEAVMKESMRLHPIIPMVVRTLMKPATIGGLRPPAPAPPSGRRSSSPTSARTTTRTRRSSGPSGSSATTRPRTRGSRSAAASAAASAPASR